MIVRIRTVVPVRWRGRLRDAIRDNMPRIPRYYVECSGVIES